MPELTADPPNHEPVHEDSRPLDRILQVQPGEIPEGCDPIKNPREFYSWLVRRLIDNGVGLVSPEKQAAGLYAPTDLMIFFGFDAKDIQEAGSFGDRSETWGMQGQELDTVSSVAQRLGEWPIHSPIWYATHANNHEATPEVPAIAVFDGDKTYRLVNKDASRHEDEYAIDPEKCKSMDEAAVAIVYLPH